MSKDISFPICVLRRLVRETLTIDLTHYKIDLKINSSVKTPSLEYMQLNAPDYGLLGGASALTEYTSVLNYSPLKAP